MDENEEEFYDSLDEEQRDPWFRGDQEPREGPICIRIIDTDVDSEIEPTKDSSFFSIENDEIIDSDFLQCSRGSSNKNVKIPLYTGETDKSDIKININKSSKSVNIRGKSDVVLRKKPPPTTYWDIYCQKNGIAQDILATDSQVSNVGSTDTVESICGSSANRTFTTSSFFTNCCLSGPCWDAPSEFEKYIPKTYAQSTISQNFDDLQSEMSDISRMMSTLTDINNLKSVSQINLSYKSVQDNDKNSIKLTKTHSNSSNQSSLRTSLILKNLCPDSSKMEMIKKQQEYGKRASIRNRARIIQKLSQLKETKPELNKKSKF